MESSRNKKVYQKLENSPFSIDSKSLSDAPSKEARSQKKIIPTSAISGLREDLKKIFLPLLIDISELRQMVENYKTYQHSPHFFPLGKMHKSPKEILDRLEQLQKDVEESQRWCSGVILQIAKGIDEAKKVLTPLDEKPAQAIEKKLSFFKRWLFRRKK